jgi:hypothetical protein
VFDTLEGILSARDSESLYIAVVIHRMRAAKIIGVGQYRRVKGGCDDAHNGAQFLEARATRQYCGGQGIYSQWTHNWCGYLY